MVESATAKVRQPASGGNPISRFAEFAYHWVFGRWPRLTMINPFWGAAQPLLQAIKSAKIAVANDVMIVSDRLSTAREVAAPGKVARVSTAEFVSGLFQRYVEPQEQFDLFIVDLSLDVIKKLRFQKVIAMARPFMRPHGKIIIFSMNGGRPLGRLKLLCVNGKTVFAGSASAIRAMEAYAAALNSSDKSRLSRFVWLPLTLAFRAPQFWWANRVERAAFRKGDIPEVRFRTSVAVTIDGPWPTDEELFDLNGDDGSFEFAIDCGAYLGTPEEAPVVTLNRVEPGAARGPENGVILTFGQSNAANSGASRYEPRHAVYTFNIFDMNYYRAVDPLPGATNDGGSVWSRLGDKLIEASLFRSVLFVPIAVGGSCIKDWTPPDGQCYCRLKLALMRLERAGIHVDLLCWHQGEADANHLTTSAEEYTSQFQRLVAQIRFTGVKAPIYIARASICENGPHPYSNHEQIRLAQQQLISSREGLLPGPDTDRFTGDHREDGCHFSEKGLDAVAQAWLESIVKNPPQHGT